MNEQPEVAVIMGSESDLPVMESATEVLKEFGVSYETRVLSAHRSPEATHEFAAKAEERGLKVLIAGAGGAAHLAGTMASLTSLPVIGVPMPSKLADGMDSLLSTVQMPRGVPVATMAVGKAGAANAALLAVRILALSNDALQKALHDYKSRMAEAVKKTDGRVKRGTTEQA